MATRRFIVLASTVSAVALLAACNGTPLAGWFDGRPSQDVPSGRHAPAMNPRMSEPKEAPAAKLQTLSPAPKSSDALMNPYDRHDAQGNETEPEEQAGDGENFFSRMMKHWDAPAETPQTAPGRKPFPGNPSSPQSMSTPAPTNISNIGKQDEPPAEAEEAQAETVAPRPVIIDIKKKPGGSALAAPVSEETPQEPTFFSDVVEKIDRTLKEDEAGIAVKKEPVETLPLPPKGKMAPHEFPSKPENKMTYPALSSVPPTPEEFTEAQKAQQERMEELQAEYMAAQQQKQNLDAEPSQTEAVKPVEKEKSEADAAPAPKEELLGQATTMTLSTPPEASAGQTNSNLSTGNATDERPLPPEMQTMEQAPEEENPARRRSWWDRMNPFGDEEEEDHDAMNGGMSEESTAPVAEEQPPAPVEQIAQPEPQVPAPAHAAQENAPPLEPLAPPPAHAAQEPLPVLSPSAPTPVAEAPEQIAQDAQAEALPSPQILRTIRMIPPSRYQARERAVQQRSAQ